MILCNCCRMIFPLHMQVFFCIDIVPKRCLHGLQLSHQLTNPFLQLFVGLVCQWNKRLNLMNWGFIHSRGPRFVSLRVELWDLLNLPNTRQTIIQKIKNYLTYSTNVMGDIQVRIVQLVAYRLGTGEVHGSNPGKGENFSVKISIWIVRIWILIYNYNMYSALWHIIKKCNL